MGKTIGQPLGLPLKQGVGFDIRHFICLNDAITMQCTGVGNDAEFTWTITRANPVIAVVIRLRPST